MAKDLPGILNRVAHGEEFLILGNNSPVARLVPIGTPHDDQRSEAIRKLRTFSKGRTLGGISIEQLVREGRR